MEQRIYARISGPVVLIGMGIIGRGLLPLLERHFEFDRSRVTVIDPDSSCQPSIDAHGFFFLPQALTIDNYRTILEPLLTEGNGRGICINLAVKVSSLAIIELCQMLGSLYVDASIEPWDGFYADASRDVADRSCYVLRENLLRDKKAVTGGPTAACCCGANPGTVSWFVKRALLNLVTDLGLDASIPQDREGWAQLMYRSGVKGIYIVERDTQSSVGDKPLDTFVNTWSADGMIDESLQPAELGWGVHESWMPECARHYRSGCGSAIYLLQPGCKTHVYSWCPTLGPQQAFMIAHVEAISLSEYFTLGAGDKPLYRPTCLYAYHPCNQAVLSLIELSGHAGRRQKKLHVLGPHEIVSGQDELGILLYGHAKNAYWYGSSLTIEQARALAPDQNATTMQVTSGVLAGMVWALENPDAGLVEPEGMDFHRCLEVQMPYLGTLQGCYTNWTPLEGRPGLFPENIDEIDPWQFRNIMVHT